MSSVSKKIRQLRTMKSDDSQQSAKNRTKDTDTPKSYLGRRAFLATSATSIALGLAGCSGSSNGDGGTNGNGGSSDGSDGNSDGGSGSDGGAGSTGLAPEEITLESVTPNEILSVGPSGADPAPFDSVRLSDAQKQEVKNSDFTVSVVFAQKGTSWVRLVEQGIRTQLDELGIELDGVQYSEFDVKVQSNILQTVAGQDNVDGVISLPVDTAATTDGYRAVADSGKELVFMHMPPDGFEHPTDYAGAVSPDNRGNGFSAAKMLTQLVGEGKVGLVLFDAQFFTTDERERAVKKILDQNDDIEYVEIGFTNPNNVFDKAQNMLTAHPDMKGIFAIWTQPAMQVVDAAQASGRDIPITTIDLGESSARNTAKGGRIKGLGAQKPFDQGVAEVNMMAMSLLGEETSPFVTGRAFPVMRKNLPEAYPKVFHKDPSEAITKHYQ